MGLPSSVNLDFPPFFAVGFLAEDFLAEDFLDEDFLDEGFLDEDSGAASPTSAALSLTAAAAIGALPPDPMGSNAPEEADISWPET